MTRASQVEYVLKMESLPTTRFRWLVPELGLERGDAVVDFGCGTGIFAEVVHDRVATYTGVDLSPDFIAHARERATRLGLRNVSFESAGIGDFCARHSERFDVAVMVNVAGYLDDREFIESFAGIRACLKPGGRAFVYIANGDYFLEGLKRRCLVPKSIAPYRFVRTGNQYRALLSPLGFTRIQVSYTPHYTAQRILHPLARLPLVGSAFEAKILVRAQK